MKKHKWQLLILLLVSFPFFAANKLIAGTTSKLSNTFTLDTRDLNPTPIDGWQKLTYYGDTFNEDLVIDDLGKSWCFYSIDIDSPSVPVYLQIYQPDGYVYKHKQTVGFGSTEIDPMYNSVRATLNSSTGDVWVAIHGQNGGYFVIFDSTGTIKQDSTLLAYNACFPKVASDKEGKMWFSWHTDLNVPVESNARFSCFQANGEILYQAQNVTVQNGIMNTDVAVDDSNHVWIVYEMNQSGDYTTRCSIFKNDRSLIVDGRISNNTIFLNTQRQIYADLLHQRMWILEKNISPTSQLLHMFNLSGNKITTIEDVRECSFARNEDNKMEVVRFNTNNESNKIYESAQFDPTTGGMFSSWETLFDSTYKFVKNGIVFNRNYNLLKTYLVNKEKNLTRIKFMGVIPGYPGISVKPNTIDFDTTKIKENYKKEMVVTVQNIGSEILVVTNITSQDSRFSAIETNFQLSPGESKNVTLLFAPTDVNQVNSIMNVLSNDPNNSSVEIQVSGIGYQPTNAQIRVNPGILIYDTVMMGESQKLPIYIQNADEYEPLVIHSFSTTDDQFTVGDSSLVISPQYGKSVEVIFSPDTSGVIEGSLIIHNNDPENPNYNVVLVGEGRAPTNPQIVVDNDTLIFGQVEIEKHKTYLIEIGNKGERTLTVENISTSNPLFTVDTTSFNVLSNYSQVVKVTFSPTEVGQFTGELTIFSNDEEESEYKIYLYGAGVILSEPVFVSAQTELSFREVLVGDSLKQSFIFQNSGDKTLKLYNISTSRNQFVVSEDDTIKIEKLQSDSLFVTFSPDDTLSYKGVLLFNTNDPNKAEIEINLYGKGKKNAPQIFVPTPYLSLNFDTLLVNTTSQKSILVTNKGIQDLIVHNILYNDNFVPLQKEFTLSFEETEEVFIIFKPDSVKRFNGKISILSNDPANENLVISATGVGRDSTDQTISLSSDSLNFGTVAITNDSEPHVLTIQNQGEKKLSILNVISSDSAFRALRTNFKVNGDSSDQLSVLFNPSEIRNYEATLKIVSDAPGNDTLTLRLTGIGRDLYPQEITLYTTSINFGVVAIDRSQNTVFAISNTGEKELVVTGFEINDNQFKISETWLKIAPNQTNNVTISYSPLYSGEHATNLRITSNDADNSVLNVSLVGTGVVYTGPRISIAQQALSFGSTLISATKVKSFWVYNFSNDSTLTITDYVLNNQAFTAGAKNIKIPANEYRLIPIYFHPQTQGDHSATLTLFSDDEYNAQYSTQLYGYGIPENTGETTFTNLGWNGYSSSPLGEAFYPSTRTENVLAGSELRAWFIKDFYLYDTPHPDSAFLNLSFENRITLVINNTKIFDSTATNVEYWNRKNLNIHDYLTFGRNRIAVSILTNPFEAAGGFDCELVVNGDKKIKSGSEFWNHDDAKWWYFYNPGVSAPTDITWRRQWFSRDYGLTEIDSVCANWVFEPNGSDTLFDNTAYGNRAILHNIQWITGIVGQAMQFSGQADSADSYVELNTNLNRTPQTIDMWINCYGAQDYRQNIISNVGSGEFGQGVFLEPDMSLGIYYFEGEYIIPDYILDANTWYNIYVQYDYLHSTNLNSVKVYVNNILIGSKTYIPRYPIGDAYTSYMGGNPLNETSSGFYGAMDELKIKNTVSGIPEIPQVASITKMGSDTVSNNDSTKISFNIFPTPYRVHSGILKYYPGGSSEKSSEFRADTIQTVETSYDTSFSFIIPREKIDIRGIKYSLTLNTNYGTVQYPSNLANENEYAFLRVTTAREESKLAIPKKTHRMISVPYELQNESVDSVLTDDFGIYNPFHWRVFDWSQLDTQYVEYDSTWAKEKGFSRGAAYWLITDRLTTFDAGEGITPPDEDFKIDLNYGWNMVGNPFPFPVNWSDIYKTSDKVKSPVGRMFLGDTIYWKYDIDKIEPWQGYFVWNGDAASPSHSLFIPPVAASIIPLKKALALDDKYRSKYHDLSILISAESRCGKNIDIENLFGVSKSAKNEYDQMDLLEVPPIGDYVSLWINNSEWENNKGFYTVDIRKSGDDGYLWNLVVDYFIKNPANIFTTEIRSVLDLPDSWLLYLFDLEAGIAIDLQKQGQISFKPEKEKFGRKMYKLVTGTEDFIKANSDEIPLTPMNFELRQNYPNPFNAATTIIFSLPKRMKTTVKIYNILGQLVKTLVDDELRGGIHKLIWNGKNNQDIILSSGMYFVRIEGKEQIQVKKMLLIK